MAKNQSKNTMLDLLNASSNVLFKSKVVVLVLILLFVVNLFPDASVAVVGLFPEASVAVAGLFPDASVAGLLVDDESVIIILYYTQLFFLQSKECIEGTISKTEFGVVIQGYLLFYGLVDVWSGPMVRGYDKTTCMPWAKRRIPV